MQAYSLSAAVSFLRCYYSRFSRSLFRLWLSPRPTQPSTVNSSGRHGGKSGSSSASGGQTTIYFTDFIPEAPDSNRIQDLVDRINKKIGQRQVKGRILSVETVSVPAVVVPPSASASGRRKSMTANGPAVSISQPFPGLPQVLNSQATRWSESADIDWPRAFVLRLFTVREPVANGYIPAASGGGGGSSSSAGGGVEKQARGQPRHRRSHQLTLQQLYGTSKILIGIKDIVPRPVDDGFYEGFEVLIDRTNTWLKDQADISIANMQSVLVQKIAGVQHMDMGSTCFHSMPGLNNEEPAEFFRILRVAYVRPVGELVAIDIPVIHPITYESFTPQLVRHKEHCQPSTTVPDAGNATASGTMTSLMVIANGNHRERMERMKEAFAKVIAYLRNSGSEVICSETVMNPVQMYGDDHHIDSLSTDSHEEDEMRFIFTIRLFLTGQIGQQLDPGSTQQHIKRASIAAGPTETDLINSPGADGKPGQGGRNAPLFLRHVVTGQFKYRWLVLAASAFSCMAIIVAVSVVYSNR